MEPPLPFVYPPIQIRARPVSIFLYPAGRKEGLQTSKSWEPDLIAQSMKCMQLTLAPSSVSQMGQLRVVPPPEGHDRAMALQKQRRQETSSSSSSSKGDGVSALRILKSLCVRVTDRGALFEKSFPGGIDQEKQEKPGLDVSSGKHIVGGLLSVRARKMRSNGGSSKRKSKAVAFRNPDDVTVAPTDTISSDATTTIATTTIGSTTPTTTITPPPPALRENVDAAAGPRDANASYPEKLKEEPALPIARRVSFSEVVKVSDPSGNGSRFMCCSAIYVQ